MTIRHAAATLAAVALTLVGLPALADSDELYLPGTRTVAGELTIVEDGMWRHPVTATLADGATARGVLYLWSRDDDRYRLQPRLARPDRYGTTSWQTAIADLDWDDTVAVVNGGYWVGGTAGLPNGLWLEDGQIHASHTRDGDGDILEPSRGTALFDRDGGIEIGRWPLSAHLSAGEDRIDLVIDQTPGPGAIALLTDGTVNTGGLHLVPLSTLTLGEQALTADGPTPRRHTAAALAATDANLLHQATSSDDVTLTVTLGELDFDPAHTIPGAPLILSGGQATAATTDTPRSASGAEALSRGHRIGRHPRTAIGVSDTYVLLLVIDGRQPGWSAGVTLAELADIFVFFGATDAVNLDGGGSTRLADATGDLNRPSEASRQVANILTIERRQATTHPGTGETIHWGRPGDTVIWCNGAHGNHPVSYRDGVWTDHTGTYALHTRAARTAADAIPVCARTGDRIEYLLWHDGNYLTDDDSGPTRLADHNWHPLIADLNADGSDNLAARRGPLTRWLEPDGTVRTRITLGTLGRR
jgi:hypothetical protein